MSTTHPLTDDVPRYVRLYETGELQRRVEEALASLERCRVCPWDCDVNRLHNHTKVCRTGRYARVASYFPHFGEERPLVHPGQADRQPQHQRPGGGP